MRRKQSNLRVVHGQNGRPTADGLDADVEALFADIESFDIDAARQRVQAIDAQIGNLRGAVSPLSSGLPSVDSLMPTGSTTVPSPANQGVAPVDVAPLGCGGLLSELREEVVSSQRRAIDQAQYVDALRDGFDQRLRAVFEYLHDLTTQLNYLRPTIAREYYFLGADEVFRGLAWLEGYADFRTQSESNGGRIERVSFGYTLKGSSAERVFERAGMAAERMRQVLFDLGLRFEGLERRNAQREVEFTSFQVADEIDVRVVWRVDFENQQVVMDSRNLERLGFASCILPMDALGPAMLDEFGRLVLGRPNTFRRFVLR